MNRRYSEATLSLIRMKSEFNAKSYNSKHSKKIGDQNYEEKEHYKQRIDAGWQPAHIWSDSLHEARETDYTVVEFLREAQQYTASVHTATEDAALRTTMEDATVVRHRLSLPVAPYTSSILLRKPCKLLQRVTKVLLIMFSQNCKFRDSADEITRCLSPCEVGTNEHFRTHAVHCVGLDTLDASMALPLA